MKSASATSPLLFENQRSKLATGSSTGGIRPLEEKLSFSGVIRVSIVSHEKVPGDGESFVFTNTFQHCNGIQVPVVHVRASKWSRGKKAAKTTQGVPAAVAAVAAMQHPNPRSSTKSSRSEVSKTLGHGCASPSALFLPKRDTSTRSNLHKTDLPRAKARLPFDTLRILVPSIPLRIVLDMLMYAMLSMRTYVQK